MNTRISTTFMITAISALLFATSAQAQECRNGPYFHLTAKESHLSLNDKMPICVRHDGNGNVNATFRIWVHPTSDALQTVAVTQKASAGQMAISGNLTADGDWVEISVVGTKPANKDIFGFIIEVAGIGMLDPKVRVVGPQYWSATLAKSLDDFLNANGVSADDAFKALADFKADEKTDEPAQ